MLLRATLLLAILSGVAHGQGGGGSPGDDLGSGSGGGQSAPGTVKVSTQLGFFDVDDQGDGNPFLDESLTVIEPIIIWDHSVSEDFGYSLKLSFDSVSSASIDRISKFPAQSGASGDFYVGVDYAPRYRRSNGDWWTWNTHVSFEYDYLSLGLGGGYSTESESGSKTTWGLSSFYDTIDIIRSDGDASEGTDSRTTVAANWSHSALLSPLWNGELSATLSAQSGFLETAYNFVAVQDGTGTFEFDNGVIGTALDEELPDTRIRGALSGRARRWLGKGKAAEIGGRVYADDWGILGLSIEPRLYLPLGKDSGLRLRYRYYTQTEADDYVKEVLPPATAAPEFRTSDSDLADFDSHSLGARFDFSRNAPSTWFVDANYAMRGDGLDQLFFSIGYSRSFGK